MKTKVHPEKNGRGVIEAVAAVERERVSIPAAKIERVTFSIIGTSPYMQSRFSEKAKQKMMAKMAEGSTAKGKKVRPPRDYDDDYRHAMHKSTEGWCGIPAGAFRTACISACRLVDFKMTLAKLSIFVHPDGFDAADMTPLVRIFGEPKRSEIGCRNDNGGMDIRIRPIWAPGWKAKVVVDFDADQFSVRDVSNLFHRVGVQVGVGEGRHDSRNSPGCGFGTFAIEE